MWSLVYKVRHFFFRIKLFIMRTFLMPQLQYWGWGIMFCSLYILLLGQSFVCPFYCRVYLSIRLKVWFKVVYHEIVVILTWKLGQLLLMLGTFKVFAKLGFWPIISCAQNIRNETEWMGHCVLWKYILTFFLILNNIYFTTLDGYFSGRD